MSKKDERFVMTHKEGSELGVLRMIYVDKETGVNYFFVKSGYGAGLTPLLGADGKPVVTTVEPDYR